MYATIDEFIASKDQTRIKNLVNDENRALTAIILSSTAVGYSATDVAVVRIDAEGDSADALIDTYLAQRYDLPLASNPTVIKDIKYDLWMYNLYKRRDEANIPDSVVQVYKTRIKELEQIRDGKNNIGLESTEVVSASGKFRTNKTSADKIFNSDAMDKY